MRQLLRASVSFAWRVERARLDEVAGELASTIITQDHARHRAAQEQVHALGDRVRAGIGEGEYVVELETLEVNLAHEHVVDRAQAAAQRPGTLIALAHGIGQRREVDRHGHLEAHHLPA